MFLSFSSALYANASWYINIKNNESSNISIKDNPDGYDNWDSSDFDYETVIYPNHSKTFKTVMKSSAFDFNTYKNFYIYFDNHKIEFSIKYDSDYYIRCSTAFKIDGSDWKKIGNEIYCNRDISSISYQTTIKFAHGNIEAETKELNLAS